MGQDQPDPTDSSTPPIPAREVAHVTPTPVRASLGDDRPEAAPGRGGRGDVVLDVDGVSWVATVGGMTRFGAGSASAPILLLHFRSQDPAAGALREAWVVGGSLTDLTDLQLEAAFRRSAEAPEAWVRKPLFPEAGSRSGKDG